MTSARILYTAGHSNRELPELIELLVEAGIRTVADVRRFPRSKRHPWFNSNALADALAEAGLSHQHFGELGGMRDAPSKELLPLVSALPEPWPAYAAHARSDEFAQAFGKLLKTAELRHPLAVLCAEKNPEDCHRRLLADAALLAGWQVVHLIAPGESREHEAHPLADLVGGRLAYRPRQTSLFD
jgi:uncharacterized protein (DUF488 family)